MDKEIKWRCPSNIALVKYWGKKGNQIPCNASLSMTLQQSFTDVSLVIGEKKAVGLELQYFFHGEQNMAFQNRISKFIEQNSDAFTVIKDHSISIHSANSFPHSAGIASSASAFGAITLALLDASSGKKEDFYQTASFLSRLGSGSACRSIYAPYALWGKLAEVRDSSDEFAIPVKEVHENFHDMRDAILIVDDSIKKVSSSKGHSLMEGHRYASARFQQANAHCIELLDVLRSGDFSRFISIIEKEALALHAMMMTSEEYFLLIKPGTLIAIEKIMDFRKESGIPVTFTLDAGPNVHILYPGKEEANVRSFIEKDLKSLSRNIIFDRMGAGPEKLSA